MPITGSAPGGGGGATALDDLTDVVITAPANSHVLHYDGATWENLNSATDWLTQYLHLPGRTNGQILGSGTHTGGATFDLATEGRLLFGPSGINFVANRFIDIRTSAVNNSTIMNIQPTMSALTGVASGILVALQVAMAGTPGYTSGSFTLRGFNFTATPTVPSGVTLLEAVGAICSTAVSTNSGTTNKITGSRHLALGSNSTTNTIPLIVGVEIQAINRISNVTNLYNILCSVASGGYTGTIDDYYILGLDDVVPGEVATVINWTGIHFPDVILPTGTILGLDIAIQGNRLKGLHLGTGATTAHFLSIENNTTTKAQIKLSTGGAVLAAPAAGAMEAVNDDLFYTIPTGPTRKTLAYTSHIPTFVNMAKWGTD